VKDRILFYIAEIAVAVIVVAALDYFGVKA